MTIATSNPETDRAHAAPVERGQGAPIVLIPGIQGRWEWMAPTIAELSVDHRVRTFSLGDVEGATDPARAFDAWVAHIDRLFDVARDRRVVVAGVSFGGLIAACYAGRRPDRVSALVLISAPPPEWPEDHPAARNVRYPLLLLPQFIAQAAGRLVPEVRALGLGAGQRLKFVVEHVGRLLRFPASPLHMAAYARAWSATDLRADCRHITAPTLVVTGEPALDRVVPVAGTLEYLQLIPGARHVTLEGTGHLGVISRPRALSDLVSAFIAETVELPGDGPRRQEHKAG